MEAKKLFGFVVAILTVLIAVSFVAASNLSVSIDEISVNDVSSDSSSTLTLAGSPEETIPVVVLFTANADAQDLKLKVWIDGYKNDISATTSRFDVLNGSTYVKRVALTLPSVEDMDNLNEDLTLHVRIADRNDEVEETYSITLERESYSLDVLSVEAPTSASAGEIIALDVVLKNIGSHEAEDAFVIVSIPELSVSRRVYFGDLTPVDCLDDCDKEDARERRIYLTIPSDAESGEYDIEARASTYDTTTTVRKSIAIFGNAASNATNNNNNSATDLSDNDKAGLPTSILVLTIVLVIIFVVLLIVLIVLLTKKPSEKSEDFGETSYY